MTTRGPTTQVRSENSTFDFDAEWSHIHAFIAAHAMTPNTLVELQIRLETLLGVSTWLCIGPGVGWPATSEAAPVIGMINFDSAENASKAAEMIQTLADR